MQSLDYFGNRLDSSLCCPCVQWCQELTAECKFPLNLALIGGGVRSCMKWSCCLGSTIKRGSSGKKDSQRTNKGLVASSWWCDISRPDHLLIIHNGHHQLPQSQTSKEDHPPCCRPHQQRGGSPKSNATANRLDQPPTRRREQNLAAHSMTWLLPPRSSLLRVVGL